MKRSRGTVRSGCF